MTPRERADLAEALRRSLAATTEALAKLDPAQGPESQPPDRLLSAREASKRTGMSTRWLYLHADDLPFAMRTSGRAVRFSEMGIDKWLLKRQNR